MKALCTSVSDTTITMEIVSGTIPEAGLYYTLEDCVKGTSAQNKALHALIQEFYRWMLRTDTYMFEVGNTVYDFSCADWFDLREKLKYRYGEGVSHYQYCNAEYEMIKVKELSDVPEYVLDDFNAGNRLRIKAILKSWSLYTKKQRRLMLDAVIDIMKVVGVDSKKFHEILNGMNQ